MKSELFKSINAFMTNSKKDCINIIKSIPSNEFDSHEFIRRFMIHFELDYVHYLSTYPTEPFRNVNAQIAKHLSEKQELYSIKSIGQIQSLNIFGLMTYNELWEKL